MRKLNVKHVTMQSLSHLGGAAAAFGYETVVAETAVQSVGNTPVGVVVKMFLGWAPLVYPSLYPGTFASSFAGAVAMHRIEGMMNLLVTNATRGARPYVGM